MIKLNNCHNNRLYITNLRRYLYSTRAWTNLKCDTPKNDNFDSIGPPDPVSNLRPVTFAKRKNETNLEKKYREARETTQSWNQNFWTKHNNSFVKERKIFQEALKEKSGNDSITSDQMSVFYKRFLDQNWRNHFQYNISWYKQNIKILILEIRVKLSKMKIK